MQSVVNAVCQFADCCGAIELESHCSRVAAAVAVAVVVAVASQLRCCRVAVALLSRCCRVAVTSQSRRNYVTVNAA
jgi:hypothetical protein